MTIPGRGSGPPQQGVHSPPSLAGRDQELAAVRAGIAVGGCLISGAAGVGKSRLAFEAAGPAHASLRVIGTESSRELPFGAFGHLVDESLFGPGAVIPGIVAALREEHPGDAPILIVDDAHLLDSGSAALVLALVTSATVRPLVTLRSGEPVPDAITALWKEHGLSRCDLQPLGRLSVRALVQDLLEGEVHALVFERVYELSQGNPLYVVQLCADARRARALERRDGIWTWNQDLLEFDRLRDLIGHRIDAVSPSARAVLELLAVAGTLPIGIAEEASPPEAIEELERLGIIAGRASAGGSGAEVVPAHPLFAEVVADALPGSTVTRIGRELAQMFLRSESLTESKRLRAAVLLLDAGDDDPELFLAASVATMRRGLPELAGRFADRAGPSLEAALARAAALAGLARYDEAAMILGPHEDAAAQAGEATGIEFVETWFRSLLEGTASVEAIEAMLDRVAGWHDSRDWSAFMATLRSWVALHAGRPHEALSLLADWLEELDLLPYRRLHVLAAAFHCHQRLGHTATCHELARSITEVVSTIAAAPWDGRHASLLFTQVARVEAAVDLEQAERELRGVLATSDAEGDERSRVVATMGLGLIALRRGHAESAVRLLGDTADALEVADPTMDRFETLVNLARARALLGDAEGAGRALANAERLGRTQPRHADREGAALERARLLVGAAGGNVSAAATALIDLADAGHDHAAVEIEALHDALRLGAPPREVLKRLRPFGTAARNDLVPLYIAHAEALGSGDGEDLLAIARRFAERGLDLHAAEAATAAARAHAVAGRADSSRFAAALARECLSSCPGVVTPALAAAPDGPAFTPREREVAIMVSRGMTNRDIAEELVLSIRTVESCVLRACRKAGVGNRRELGELLEWAPPPVA